MKRIRVELDVTDKSFAWWNQQAKTDRDLGAPRAQVEAFGHRVRSVEVVEPERWTELVLHRKAVDKRPETAVCLMESNGDRSAWRVVSCTEREEYPNG
jgi:hypothetical protein